MARTTLAAQDVLSTGLAPVYSAANVDGHSIANSGKEILVVKNGGGTSINVTVQTAALVSGLAVADQVVSVPAGGERMIGRLSTSAFNRAASDTDPNTVYVDFSAITSVTVALIRP